MKTLAITFAFAACLVNSLAFADNPTDAPLMSNDGNTTLAQQENVQRDNVQKNNRVGHNRWHQNKKDGSLSTKAKNENPSKNSRQGEQSNPGYPTATGN